MSGKWIGSTRRERLPADWLRRVAAVKRRDQGRCTWMDPHGRRCAAAGTDVDHIRRGDDHALSNLRLLCRAHHAYKSSREGNAARGPAITKARPAEKHPGIV